MSRPADGSATGLDTAWFDDPDAVAGRASDAAAARASYRLGDARLDLDSDAPGLLDEIHDLWAECAERPGPRNGVAPPPVLVGCRVRSLGCGLVLVAVVSPEAIDILGVARGLLEPRPGDYVRQCTAASGWQLLARHDAASAPLIAVAGGRCVVDVAHLPAFFLRDFVVGLALRAQTSVLFLHAASVDVGGRGALLLGRAGAGKTTLALALAARGHVLLGDDFAALRRATRELLPVPRTLHVRDGLRAAAVTRALAEREVVVQDLPGAGRRQCVTPQRLFPGPRAQPAPLAAAFFLRRFQRTPALTPFTPSLADMAPLRTLPIRHQWGIAAGARFMRFALAVRLLSSVPCFHLDVARPEATVALIESVLASM